MTKKPRIPRWPANRFAYLNAINRVEPFSETELDSLVTPLRKSFEALKSGAAVERDFHDICAALNTTLVRSQKLRSLKAHTRCVNESTAALDALDRVWARFQKTGRWGFDGPGMIDVEFALHLHEEFCGKSTPLELMNALKEVARIGIKQGSPA